MTILNDEHLKSFHRKLYAGFNETVTLLKTGDNQQAGTVTPYRLYDCRWSRYFTTKEPLDQDISASQSRTLHIPVSELRRVGLEYVEAGDKFQDKEGRFWLTEATVTITNKLKQWHLDVPCTRVYH